MTKASDHVDRVVRQIDDDTRSYLSRDPDSAPDRKFVPPRQLLDPAVRRAKARMRTAAWRLSLDNKRRPETRDIGMALVTALATTPFLMNPTGSEVRLVEAALEDLERRGFDRSETLAVLTGLRKRLLGDGAPQGMESGDGETLHIDDADR